MTHIHSGRAVIQAQQLCVISYFDLELCDELPPPFGDWLWLMSGLSSFLKHHFSPLDLLLFQEWEDSLGNEMFSKSNNEYVWRLPQKALAQRHLMETHSFLHICMNGRIHSYTACHRLFCLRWPVLVWPGRVGRAFRTGAWLSLRSHGGIWLLESTQGRCRRQNSLWEGFCPVITWP